MALLSGPLMLREVGDYGTVDELPFKTGDLLNFLQERPLYFTAKQVQSWIEHLAPQIKVWVEGLSTTTLYKSFYDACECDERTMWDTVDSLYYMVLKFQRDETIKPGDAFEHTAYHTAQMVKITAAPGFLFDLPADEKPDDYDREDVCRWAIPKVLIAAMVDLREEREKGFFSKLVSATLPEPDSLFRVHIDNGPVDLSSTATAMNRGAQWSMRPSAINSVDWEKWEREKKKQL